MTGFLGEIAFELLYPKSKYVGGRILSHDYVLGRKKIDIKAKTCGANLYCTTLPPLTVLNQDLLQPTIIILCG